MAENRDKDYSGTRIGGQDIYQNSCNFKYFLVVIFPFLCPSIFFILLRRVYITVT
jgi:hypothetical protein